MKILLLIRHAKSGSKDAGIRDFDRPLTDRGIKDAAAMAKKIIKRNLIPQRLISSSALRAKTTAMLMAREWKLPATQIHLKPELYDCQVNVFQDLVADLDNSKQVVAIFGHNPTITQFANSLTQVKVENIPTCGIIAIRIPTHLWGEFKSAKKELLFFDFPGLGKED